MKEIEKYDFKDQFNNFYAFLIGVDEADFSAIDGSICCRFRKDSPRYSYIKLAKSFLDTYNECDAKERQVLVKPINELIESMESVISTASNLFNGKLDVRYDEETQSVINKMKGLIQGL